MPPASKTFCSIALLIRNHLNFNGILFSKQYVLVISEIAHDNVSSNLCHAISYVLEEWFVFNDMSSLHEVGYPAKQFLWSWLSIHWGTLCNHKLCSARVSVLIHIPYTIILERTVCSACCLFDSIVWSVKRAIQWNVTFGKSTDSNRYQSWVFNFIVHPAHLFVIHQFLPIHEGSNPNNLWGSLERDAPINPMLCSIEDFIQNNDGLNDGAVCDWLHAATWQRRGCPGCMYLLGYLIE